VLATFGDLKDSEMQLNWETEMPIFQGFWQIIVSFLVRWFLSVGIHGTQRGILRSYARKREEVACPRGLSFPPMVEANPHADNDPPRCNDPGRGGPLPGQPATV